MKTIKVLTATALAVSMVVGSISTVWAGETSLYDWPAEDAPVLVKNDSGVVLIGTDKTPLRALSWDANDGDHDQPVRLVDLRDDGSPNIVGSGSPSFVTDASGEPLFSFEDGCRQLVVSDIVQGTNLDVICVNSGQIRVYTDRGRFAWSVSPGRNVDYCLAGDLTGDARNDLECAYRGGNQFLRVSHSGEVLVTGAENQNLEGATEDLDEFPASADEVWTGERRIDGGDAKFTVEIEEGTLTIEREGQEEAVSEIDFGETPLASVVKDLDGDGAQEVVLASASRIYVISDGGETIEDFSADAGDYRRVPDAELASVYANGFGEADADAREAIEDIQDQLTECYADRLRAAPFAGSGRQVMQVFVGEDGDVQQVQKRQSAVGDDEIEDCAVQVVEAVSYPAAEEGRAMVNITVVFTFRDEER